MSFSPLNFARIIAEGTPDVSFALRTLLDDAASAVPDLQVEGVNADSRAIAAGEAFFAVPGTRVHGDDFAAQAIGRGAVAKIGRVHV